MGLVFNPFTGTFDFTGSSGGGGGTIGGTIAANQVAFGTGVDTIGGSANLTWDTSIFAVGGTPAATWAAVAGTALNERGYLAYDITSLSANPSGSIGNINAGFISNVSASPVADDPDFSSVAAIAGLTYVPASCTKAIGNIVGTISYVVNDGSGNTNGGITALDATASTSTEVFNMEGIAGQTTSSANITENRAGYAVARQFGGTAQSLFGYYAGTTLFGAGAAVNSGGLYVLTQTGVSTNYFGVYVNAQAARATNPYSFWSDEQGVFRIRSDNTFDSVVQAIPALYNPRFTKYIAGAADYERIVMQWETDVATLTTEKGGTGTLRALNLGDTGVQVKINSKNITLSGNLTTTGAFNPTFAIPSSSSWTFPSGGGTLVLTSRSIATTSPLAGGGDLSADRTLTIADAVADGSTKGAATFTAADFNSSSGLISIDYTNGQAASGAVKGFLTAADWTTFNNKGSGSVTSIATTSPISGGTITGTGTISLLVNVDFGWTVGQTITAPAGATALTLAGGTQTSSFPVISATQTWNASGTTFTALKLNVTSSASAAASLLLDLQVGSATQFFVTKGGQVETPYNTSTGLAYAIHASGQNLVGFSRNTAVGGVNIHGGTATTPGDSNATMVVQGSTGSTPLVAMDSATKFGWASSNVTQSLDAILTRDAAQTVVQRNGTTAQKFKVYNTFTTVDTVGEWFAIDWITTANVCNLQAVKGSSSGTARVLTLSYGGAQASPVAAITIPITSGAITFGGGILLPAGAAGAGLAPLKFTSGTNLTTAEAGAMEYNGTNLFFTRAGTTRENVLVAVDNAAVPTTTIGIGIVNFYGSSAANFLGDPNRWLSVNVLGTVYKIPLYT